MKTVSNYIFIFLLTMFFASCQKDIQFKGQITEPLVVVNSFITPDSIISAQISESQFFLSNQVTFNLIDNANISLFVNGAIKEKMTSINNGVYLSSYKPVIGDSVRFLVQTPGKKDVSCITYIEPQTTILSIDTSRVLTGDNSPIINYQSSKTGTISAPDTIGNRIGSRLKFVLNFTDNAKVQNFYRLIVLTKTFGTFSTQLDYSFSFDDLASGNSNNNSLGFSTSFSSNGYNVFSDDIFNGKQYPLTFSILNDRFQYSPGHEQPIPRIEVNINLQSISKSYYYYLKSRAVSGGNSFFSEPVQVYNNVVGGIGILGSYTNNVRKIVL